MHSNNSRIQTVVDGVRIYIRENCFVGSPVLEFACTHGAKIERDNKTNLLEQRMQGRERDRERQEETKGECKKFVCSPKRAIIPYQDLSTFLVV